MKTELSHLVIALAAVICLSCSKNTDDEIAELPVATTESSSNNFGCLFNGSAWIPQNNQQPVGENLQYFYDAAEGLTIKAIRQSGKTEEFIYITISDFHGTGLYTVGMNNIGVAYTNYAKPGSCITLFSRQPGVHCSGTIKITKFDAVGKNVSGTFDLKVSKDDCEAITLSHGRFNGMF